nr:hypothetical protein [Tanacetum cinerariifolium]
MESLNFNFQEIELHELQQMQDNAEERCMASFRLLHSHLKSILERAKHKREKDRRVNDKMMQSKERKDDSSKALDVGLVVTESNETESKRHVLRNKSGNDTHTDDANINSVNDKQPMAEVHLSVEHNILANEQ